jgi:hypothetical protein
MNIVPRDGGVVTGVLIEFPVADLAALVDREIGYTMVDVSSSITPSQTHPVQTFISPDNTNYEGKMIHQEYLDICLGGVPKGERDAWLSETIIECDISLEPRPIQYRHA